MEFLSVRVFSELGEFLLLRPLVILLCDFAHSLIPLLHCLYFQWLQ